MNLLEETKQIFQTVRTGMVLAMQKLYQVREEKAWEAQYSSFGEFVEDGLGISQSFASKLLTVNQTYLLDGQVSPDKLAGIDYEKLYLARDLPGPIDEKIEKARTLSRRELKESKNDEIPHEHVPVSICKTCSIRL